VLSAVGRTSASAARGEISRSLELYPAEFELQQSKHLHRRRAGGTGRELAPRDECLRWTTLFRNDGDADREWTRVQRTGRREIRASRNRERNVREASDAQGQLARR